MARSNRPRRERRNRRHARASATVDENVHSQNEQPLDEHAGNIASEGSILDTKVMVAATANVSEAARPASAAEHSENVDIAQLSSENASMVADSLRDSAGKNTDAAPAPAQSAGTMAVKARRPSSILKKLDLDIAKKTKRVRFEGIDDDGEDTTFALMAVSVSENSDSSDSYHSLEDDDEEVESALLLPDTPRNDENDGYARPPSSTDSEGSDSGSEFSFDTAFTPCQKKMGSTTMPKVVRPPAIFDNNIADFNPSVLKKPLLNLGSFQRPPPLDLPIAAAVDEEERNKARPVARVSEEALASLSVTHIASDLIKYFVRTHGPAFLQRLVTPTGAEGQNQEEAADETPALPEIFGFGSPIDNIIRVPAPWEVPFGSPVDEAPRPPAPWEIEEQEAKVDPLSVPLPDDEEVVEEEEWKEMVDREWHEDVPGLAKIDAVAAKNAWDAYCAKRRVQIENLLKKEETEAAADAALEHRRVAFTELEASVVFDKLNLSDIPRAKLCEDNLCHRNHRWANVFTGPGWQSIESCTSCLKHRFLEQDYSKQVFRRMKPTGPGFGTGLGIVLEHPESENSQRDMRLAEDAAAQSIYFFDNRCKEYKRPPIQRSRDEILHFPTARIPNPELYKRSGVIFTRESDVELFHCTMERPPLDLAVSQSRKSAPFKKHLVSDVWKVPPPPPPPSEDNAYYRTLDKLELRWNKFYIRYIRSTFFGY